LPFVVLFGLVWFLLGSRAIAQTVEPVISEYGVNADGKFALTNGTLIPMVVVLEPKSFSITPDGQGVFRPLDHDIHVDLSAMSARLEPGQTYYVFYKAYADRLPAWFTVYSTFSSLQHGPSMDVRIMLPHTVYLYQKKASGQRRDQYRLGDLGARCEEDRLRRGESRLQFGSGSGGEHYRTSYVGEYCRVPPPTRWEASPGTKLGRKAAARDAAASFRALHAETVACHSRQMIVVLPFYWMPCGGARSSGTRESNLTGLQRSK
jgi:hypothetical protein